MTRRPNPPPPDPDDLWPALCRWYGVLQVRVTPTEAGRFWVMIEECGTSNPRVVGRGRTMTAAVRAAWRETRRRRGY